MSQETAPHKLNDNWKTWMAYSLLNGLEPQRVREAMISYGVSPLLAKAAVEDALSHPYLKAGYQLREKFDRREWLLNTIHEVGKRADKEFLDVPKIEAPLYDEFKKRYYSRNRPVIVTNAIEDWPAKDWTPESIRELAGDAEVEVQYDRAKDPLYQAHFNRHSKKMKFADFIDDVLRLSPSNDLYMTSNNKPMEHTDLQCLKKDYGEIRDGYFAKQRRGDLWLGPAGTITPIHHDLTNNFFIQIYGRKKIKLVSPLQTPKLYNEFFVYSKADFSDINTRRFPKTRELDICEFVLEPGQALFLPIGWWHHIESLDISISLTFIEFKGVRNDHYSSFPKPKHILKA